jgi:membrane protease YdiL (CAAX protease family)
MAGQPLALLVVPVLYLLQAGLEELGWRGYMLDRLQARFSPLIASLVMGVCHALWHLPMFFVVGTNQIQWGFGPDFWLFIGVALAMSLVATWCYGDNRRSTFAVIALHFTYNLNLDVWSAPGMQQRAFQGLVIVGALVGTLLWRTKRPGRRLSRLQKGEPAFSPK